MRSVLILAASLACAAAAVASAAAFADEPRRIIDMSRALDGGAPSPGLPDITITKTPPDPPPLVERSQWVYDLRWDHGDLWLVGVHPLELPAPQATPRAMGRFAVELFEGPTLIERVRFDFPLLGVAEPDGSPSFGPRLKTRIGVVFPATRRGTRLELWDRATNRRWALPWPPQAPEPGRPTGEPREGGPPG
ncbi:MAG: hypothetical protein ACRELB_23990 [Polyangiaceae bacterium]